MRFTTTYGAMAIVTALAVVGCGGSTSGPDLSTAASTQVGAMNVSYIGKPKAFSSQGGSTSLSVVGMSGASFLTLGFAPQPKMSDVSFVYSVNAVQGEVWINSGSGSKLVTNLIDGAYQPVCTMDGRIAFTSKDALGNYQVFTCYQDGSGLKQITTSTLPHFIDAWAPNNQKFLFDTGTDLYIANADGSGETRVYKGGTMGSFSPDSTKVIFRANNASGKSQIYLATTSGTGVTLMSPGYSTQTCGEPSFSPDGKRIMYTEGSGTQGNIVQANLTNTLDTMKLNGTTNDEAAPVYSPDGNSILFYRTSSHGFLTSLVTGDYASPVYLGGSGTQKAIYTPFLQNRIFAGTSGTMFSTPIAGFLWTQNTDSFASLLAFTATTPSTASITQMPTNPSAAQVFHIHADTITGLKYTNSYYVPSVSVAIGTPTDILISVNPYSGVISTVVPYIIKAGVSRPMTQNGTGYSGSFPAIYDAKGKNLAPNGAHYLAFDPKTGAPSVIQ